MRKKTLSNLLSTGILWLLICACGGQQFSPRNQQLAIEQPPAGLPLASLPFPDDTQAGPRTAAALDEAVYLGAGSSSESDDAVISGDDLILTPPAGELSWAIYEFQGYADADELQLVEVEFEAPLPEYYYLAVADFNTHKWHILERGSKAMSAAETDAAPFPAGVMGISPAGNCYLAVLLYDSPPARIYSITLTADLNPAAPLAELKLDQDEGNTPLLVSFNGNGSVDQDGEGTIALYEWDWEGDGVYDESGPADETQHLYPAVGTYYPTLRVTDSNDGLTDTAQREVHVHGWLHTLGSVADDNIRDVCASGDWVFAVGNTNFPEEADWHGLLISFDAQGNKRWLKLWDSENLRDYFYSVLPLGGGDFVAVGNTGGDGSSDEALLIVKFDRHGNEIWARTWNSPDYDTAYDVARDLPGNLYVTGITRGFRFDGRMDAVLLKYDPAGTLVWEKVLTNDDNTEGKQISVNLTGEIYLGAEVRSYGNQDIAVFEITSAGAVTEENVFGFVDSVNIGDMKVDFFGKTYLTGFYGPGINADGFTAEMNSDGTMAWVKHWEIGNPCRHQSLNIRYNQFLSVTDIYVGGYAVVDFNAVGTLLHYDSDGTLEGSIGLLHEEGVQLFGIASGANGALLMCGTSDSAGISLGPVSGTGFALAYNTEAGDATMNDVSAVKLPISGEILEPAVVELDTGAGYADGLIGSYLPEDLF